MPAAPSPAPGRAGWGAPDGNDPRRAQQSSRTTGRRRRGPARLAHSHTSARRPRPEQNPTINRASQLPTPKLANQQPTAPKTRTKPHYLPRQPAGYSRPSWRTSGQRRPRPGQNPTIYRASQPATHAQAGEPAANGAQDPDKTPLSTAPASRLLTPKLANQRPTAPSPGLSQHPPYSIPRPRRGKNPDRKKTGLQEFGIS